MFRSNFHYKLLFLWHVLPNNFQINTELDKLLSICTICLRASEVASAWKYKSTALFIVKIFIIIYVLCYCFEVTEILWLGSEIL